MFCACETFDHLANLIPVVCIEHDAAFSYVGIRWHGSGANHFGDCTVKVFLSRVDGLLDPLAIGAGYWCRPWSLVARAQKACG